MSRRASELLLDDIREAIEKIERYTRDLSLDGFMADEKTQDAVVRNLGIIGEIRETLKMWLPNVRILEPERLRKNFFTEVQKWLSWQNI